MKVSTIIFAVLVSAVAVYAQAPGPLITALQPGPEVQDAISVDTATGDRQKRSLLLGAGAAAAAVGLGAVGAGVLGAGIIGAKAGFLGGALASGALSHGRSYGGYYGGYGGGYYGGGYGGYRSYGGYGGYGGYRSYYPSSYVVESWW